MTAVPERMRVAVMYDVDDIRLETRPTPEPGPGELLVRMEASGVCSGDLMPWYVRKKAPFVFGHEPAGTIVGIGGGAAARNAAGHAFAVGERVFAHHHAPCLRCERCARGAFVQCAEWRRAALEPGGMAEYFCVRRTADVLPLPDGLGFAEGSLVEPLACVAKSLRRAGGGTLAALHERSVYVIGLGVMGLLHIALARSVGAVVYGADFIAARRALAEGLGAAATFAPADAAAEIARRTDGGADVVVCGPGSPPALAHAVACVGPDGTVVLFTPIAPEERFVFDQSAAYFRDVRLVSSYSCGPDDTRVALETLACGTVDARALGAVAFPLAETARAYAEMAAARLVKAVIVPDET